MQSKHATSILPLSQSGDLETSRQAAGPNEDVFIKILPKSHWVLLASCYVPVFFILPQITPR